MAALAAEPLAVHNGSVPNGSFIEQVDIDAYINFDQPIESSPSASLSPESRNENGSQDENSETNKENEGDNSKDRQSRKEESSSVASKKSSQSLDNDTAARPSSASTTSKANSSTKPNNFVAMPSHEYEQFKQQTGLPPGALANTFAMNMSQPLGSGGCANGMGFSHNGFGVAGLPGMNMGVPMGGVGMNAMGINGMQYFVPSGMGFSSAGAGMMTPGAGATSMNLGGVSLGGMPMTPGASMYGPNTTVPNSIPTAQNMPGATAGGFGTTQQQPQQQQRQYPQEAWGVESGAHPSVPILRDDDIDFDLDDAAPSSSSSREKHGQFVDPNAINPNPLSPDLPSSSGSGSGTQVGRMYPGMHSQQAAMAKAAAENRRAQQVAAQQRELLRRHQEYQNAIRAQQNAAQVQMQQPQIAAPMEATKSGNKQSLHPSVPQTDPIVEDRISRLLNTMRQTAADARGHMSSDIPATKPTPLHITRTKKDEDEMDEDERLLASEEGKKLSSKERRQLRNKVSARAFRSRRKEYIGQLEGEVAAKTSEANDLRMHNRALAEENARLTELTRMLLSSPQFATFLNDYSGIPPPSQNQSQQQQQQQLQQQQRNAIAAAVQSQAQAQAQVQASPQGQMQGQVPMLPSQNSHSQASQPQASHTEATAGSYNFAAPPMQSRPSWNPSNSEIGGPDNADAAAPPAPPTASTQQATAAVFALTDVEYHARFPAGDTNNDVLGSLMGFGPSHLRDNLLASTRDMEIEEPEDDDI